MKKSRKWNVLLIFCIHNLQICKINGNDELFSERMEPGGGGVRNFIQFAKKNIHLNGHHLLSSSWSSIISNFCQQVDKDIIAKPMARLYSGSNLTGDYEDYNPGGRLNPAKQKLKMATPPKSIDTFGTCVRLYGGTLHYDGWCDGPSIPMYPKYSPTTNKTVHEFFEQEATASSSGVTNLEENFQCVGPCFDNELDETVPRWVTTRNLTLYEKMAVRDDKDGDHQGAILFVPERVTIYRVEGRSETPIAWYILGHHGRVEYIDIHIKPEYVQHALQLGPPNVTLGEELDWFDSLEDRLPDDNLGHYLGWRIAPKADLIFRNIFPQTNWNRLEMEKQETRIVDYLTNNPKASIFIAINVDYPGKTATRPNGLSYHINLDWTTTPMVYLTNL